MDTLAKAIAFVLSGIVKIVIWCVTLVGKIIFAVFKTVFITPFKPYFERDSRCHGSKFDRFSKKVAYNADKYDEFMKKNPMVQKAGEEIGTRIKKPINVIGRGIYSVSAAVAKDDYHKIVKESYSRDD